MAGETSDTAGDGATTATVLAQAIYREGLMTSLIFCNTKTAGEAPAASNA